MPTERPSRPIVDRDKVFLQRLGALLLTAAALGFGYWYTTAEPEVTDGEPTAEGVTPGSIEDFTTRTRGIVEGDRFADVVRKMGRFSTQHRRSPNVEHHIWKWAGGATLELDVDVTTGRCQHVAARVP